MMTVSTSLDTIECPHCHESFPITAALQPLIEHERNALNREALEKEQTLQKQAEALKVKAAQLAAAEEEIDKQVTERVQETIAQSTQELRKEAQEEVSLQLQALQTALQEKSQKIVELQNTELALR